MKIYKILNDEVVIGMPPGVGDLHWIMTKMESFKKKNGYKKIKALIPMPEGSLVYYSYSIEYFDLLPFIDSSEQYLEAGVRPLEFEYALEGGSGNPLIKDRGDCDYLIEFNSSLEKGIQLKDILPEYEINYDYPILEPAGARTFADNLKSKIGDKLIIFFTGNLSAYEASVGDLWTPESWMQLMIKIYEKTACKPVLVGAKWDATYEKELKKLDVNKIIHSMIGKTSLAQLFALLRIADLVIAWQCGVGIMATQFKTPTISLWPIKNKINPKARFERIFTRSWLPPWADDIGYIAYGWGDEKATPDGIFEAARKYL